MRNFIIVIIILIVCSSCSNTIYVVRHAEKATGIDPTTMKPVKDPPLSLEGQERALKLKEILGSKGIRVFFSTNTLRTISTATPLKELYLNTPINIYSSKPDSLNGFINRIKQYKKENVLIVGHSNTVDDIVNALCGKQVIPGDLDERIYDNLFILKRKGKAYQFNVQKFGAPPKMN